MSRRRWMVGGLLAGAVAMSAGLARARAEGSFGVTGQAEVKHVEVLYRAGSPLKMRVFLVTGLMVEHEAANAEDGERLLRLVQTQAASPRARLFAELEGTRLRSLMLSVSTVSH